MAMSRPHCFLCALGLEMQHTSNLEQAGWGVLSYIVSPQFSSLTKFTICLCWQALDVMLDELCRTLDEDMADLDEYEQGFSQTVG